MKRHSLVTNNQNVWAGKRWLAGEPRISRLSPGKVRVVAPAKVNLTLWVGPRGQDDYHPIESIVALISLVDRLTVELAGPGCVLTCNNPDLPCDESNLVVRAAQVFGRKLGSPLALRMHLDKTIPIASGLGGGSADAAACLLALSDLYQTGYSNAQLTELATELGSDVPLFLGGPISLIRGRGEQVESATFDWPFWAVLILPDTPLATAAVYAKFDELLTQAPATVRIKLQELGLYGPWTFGQRMFNMLAPAVFEMLPEMAVWQQELLAAGATSVQISGSGSALFCLFDSLEQAEDLVSKLSPRLRAWAQVVHGGHR